MTDAPEESQEPGAPEEPQYQELSEKELKEILVKGGECLNIDFPRIVADRIASFSCGMPAVAHQLALTMCFEAGIA